MTLLAGCCCGGDLEGDEPAKAMSADDDGDEGSSKKSRKKSSEDDDEAASDDEEGDDDDGAAVASTRGSKKGGKKGKRECSDDSQCPRGQECVIRRCPGCSTCERKLKGAGEPCRKTSECQAGLICDDGGVGDLGGGFICSTQ